jgi:hypothetical protein
LVEPTKIGLVVSNETVVVVCHRVRWVAVNYIPLLCVLHCGFEVARNKLRTLQCIRRGGKDVLLPESVGFAGAASVWNIEQALSVQTVDASKRSAIKKEKVGGSSYE